MKNQYIAFIVFIIISIYACGNNTEQTKVEKEPITEKIEAEAPVGVTEALETTENATVMDEVVTEENQENIVGESKNTEEVTPKIEEVTAQVKTVVPEVIKEEKPAVLEVVKAKHDAWDALTKKYVTAFGKVNYKGMKADLSKISSYLEHLKNTAPKNDWSKNEKLAYWINLYNASTVYLIASNYPTSSITKLNGGKPWDKKFVKSGDKTYSLNDIENKIVRPQFKDPRIHAALNCAAKSCPKLLNGAFLPKKLNVQLDEQVFAWVNDESKNKLTIKKLQLSQIFDWYKADFKAGGGVVKFISKYSKMKFLIDSNAKISYLEYDWALNE